MQFSFYFLILNKKLKKLLYFLQKFCLNFLFNCNYFYKKQKQNKHFFKKQKKIFLKQQKNKITQKIMQKQQKQGTDNYYNPDYKNQKQKLQEFITDFVFTSAERDNINIEEIGKDQKYLYLAEQALASKNTEKRLDILLEDLESYYSEQADQRILNGIRNNTLMFQSLFEDIIQQLIDDGTINQPQRQQGDDDDDDEVLENIEFQMQQREQRQGDLNPNDPRNKIHPLIKKKIDVYIIRGGQTKENKISMRQLKAEAIGSLVTVESIVLRISDVRPQIVVASYACESCGNEIFQSVHGVVFTPLNECQSSKCQTNRTRGKLTLITQNCKFRSYQEVTVQETSDQVPQGSIPRSYLILCKASNVRKVTPGDLVQIQGVLCPLLDNSFRGASKSTLDTYIDVFQITKLKKKYSEQDINEEIQQQIIQEQQSNTPEELYNHLAASIAPEIHGQTDVKKAMLLMMVGGDQLKRDDGMHIRGDINIALIGDPGIAKSQLLKQISKNAPRSIYTTGKGSSGVGLTASVLKDPQTGDVSLEAGALVLADKGVCCIDEFDKMNEYDRTAIHEVMEQQTVSIAKAGITCTLNARTSILAAANPLYSRYNKKMSIQENVNMPAALLSRFDLVFILVDRADENKDALLAQHIGNMHKDGKAPQNQQTDKEVYSNEFMKNFIGMIKNSPNEPKLSPEVHKLITQEYVQRRKMQNESKDSQYTTARTLLSIIRLATAHAKIRQSANIEEEDVNEAIRLLDVAQESVRDEDDEETNQQRRQRMDVIDKLFNEIKRKCNLKSDKTIQISAIRKAMLNMNLAESDLQNCFQRYGEDLQLLVVTENTVTLT